MLRPLTKIPTPSLHKPSRALTKADLETPEIKQLIADMIPTMYHEQGIGLAAPQVGVNVQVCIIGKDCFPEAFNIQDRNKDMVLINPAYTRTSRRAALETEGCLSVPGKQGKVKRYKEIHVTALDEHGVSLTFHAGGYFAHVIQHETDHLNSTLYIDKAKSVWEIE
ncbi:MAG: peptide deformylase [Candidatus Magasanikbacteria bacterium CG11_big_fil_rev_8_21_14_0_20_43_7]|uniref:Peptide deformylase n=1 Tax=Candidatus Magasanikbacteria bacterium CG11_big_fil_rev_8_21_14_0_20_43_7 TaxID=1974654 RepID=A0A2H0N2K1_9BACT|nr:MAG: peptide deformylase [Candidatus Magasanikbacteria bacterium CG11_big_fil_rev_8_21_14_0_20_43_7]